ncbi:MAG: type II toxin-antitoxin system Phd/YefM family antitoxin, partial [Spirochaetales bacterium]|nr:type II toxin-antitoxin system Phd/YefM family antitoxin [Spirochaetales bacterium]
SRLNRRQIEAILSALAYIYYRLRPNLKDSLSRYLRMVQNGERIIITDHNRIIAEIVPASACSDNPGLLEEYLKEKPGSGALVPATKNGEKTN